MSLEVCVLFFPPSGSYSELTFSFFLGFLFLAAVFGFWLVPGGLAWALSRLRRLSHHKTTAIPGPSGLPLLGLAPAFTGFLTHIVLAKLANTFKAKQLMAFSVGFTRFIISSHPDTAKEILNSSAFADRPIKESAYELLFHRAMGFAPFGEYWRNLRRISATHMFSPKRIVSFGDFRTRIGLQMVAQIKDIMERYGEVKVRPVLHFGALNNVMMSTFGRIYEFGDSRDDGGLELEELVREGYDLLGVFNWSDHFPVLGFLDLQGVKRRCRKLEARVSVFVGKIIEEHRMKRFQNETSKAMDEQEGSGGDFVDVLLDLEKDNRLNDSDMVAVLWEMIFRGTDTVAILVEWILARMVVHPQVQYKAQCEIDSVVGSNRSVTDQDLPNLPYVRAVVKETLRMHPPGPLLSWARLAIHDTHVGQHFVPAGTTAMVNMWAITHDQEVWPEPSEFKPERFMGQAQDVSVLGSDLRLAPFGSGRRVCPGKAMGLATVELWFSLLLQKFKWVPSVAGVDLAECLRLSLEMKHSLVCEAIPRDP
ncbi:cytochrome P450 78A5 [Prosopis cineraria]|uniref:cytochrome P450 78A5 n=1 Tax=Prosopis cineraria TaxID=364024 RepID=UPI00240F6EEB|nr:cytochrome P450 78A5 [Prosopis cineraria]